MLDKLLGKIGLEKNSERWMKKADPRIVELYNEGKLTGVPTDFLERAQPLLERAPKKDSFVKRKVDKDHLPVASYREEDQEPTSRKVRWIVGSETADSLGSGGTGKVTLGRDTVLNKWVAVKALQMGIPDSGDTQDPNDVAQEQILIQDMEREAKTLANLSHRCLPEVYDFMHVNGVPVIVMELFDKRSEYQHLEVRSSKESSRLSLRQFFQAATDLTDLIDYCAKNDVYHRDLKPGNILINKEGRVKVLDLGLSNWAQGNRSDRELGGTASYLSPERVGAAQEGDSQTLESEIFTLGSLFYEMITGKVLFPDIDKTYMDVAMDIYAFSGFSDEQVAAITHGCKKMGLPVDAVGTILEKMLRPDPRDRYHSGAEVIADLKKAVSKQP